MRRRFNGLMAIFAILLVASAAFSHHDHPFPARHKNQILWSRLAADELRIWNAPTVASSRYFFGLPDG